MFKDLADAPDMFSRFCNFEPFRSAKVDELLLNDNFYRRPLRPEDLAFVDFVTPIADGTFESLSSLMAQRILLCINESAEPSLPASAAAEPAWRAFHASGETGRELVPRLEAHAFGFLSSPQRREGLATTVARSFDSALDYWEAQRTALERADYAQAGLRFLLIQHVPLYESAAATARLLPGEIADAFAAAPFTDNHRALVHIMQESGLRTGRHSYWQFYLPGSLAAVNLLHRLARSPLTVAGYAGARLVFEAERAALLERFRVTSGESCSKALIARAEHLQALLSKRLGPAMAAQAESDARLMAKLLVRVRRALNAQLEWLRDIAWAERAAHKISERIGREVPDIDRDTFVEPREMCSTTHVHDEHRLVVIESGQMRFWGNVGMAHDMGPGDMVLVPKGRLHGSTVLSESCTYHQPIIPDDWEETMPDAPRVAAAEPTPPTGGAR